MKQLPIGPLFLALIIGVSLPAAGGIFAEQHALTALEQDQTPEEAHAPNAEIAQSEAPVTEPAVAQLSPDLGTPVPPVTAERSLQSSGGALLEDVPAAAPAPGANSREADLLEDRLRSHRVRLRENGTLQGSISVFAIPGGVTPMSDIKVSFVQNGRVAAEVRPAGDGIFTVRGIAPGVYSVIGSSPKGYIAYSIELYAAAPMAAPELNAGDESPVLFQEIEDDLAIDSLAVPPADFPTVAELALSYLPPELVSASNRSAIPPAIAEVGGDLDLTEDNDPDAEVDQLDATTIHRHAVQIQADGSVVGRMRRLHPRTGHATRLRRLNVFLVQGDRVVSRAAVSPTGIFSLQGVDPGLYSVVASGIDGFAAFAVQTVPRENPVVDGNRLDADGITQVAMFAPAPPRLDITGGLVPPENVEAALDGLSDSIGDQDDGDEDLADSDTGAGDATPPLGEGIPVETAPRTGNAAGIGGVPGGGVAGGGGAPGGGGGLGALLGAAALGLAAFALAEDDNNDDGDGGGQPPASPSVP